MRLPKMRALLLCVPQCYWYKIHFTRYPYFSLFIFQSIIYKINGLIFVKQKSKEHTSCSHILDKPLIYHERIEWRSWICNINISSLFQLLSPALTLQFPVIVVIRIFSLLIHQGLKPFHACVLFWQSLLSFMLSDLDQLMGFTHPTELEF